jgi:hypothetical protein
MRPQLRRLTVPIAVLAAVPFAPAQAQAVPDFTLSRLTCAPADGTRTRPGDDVRCRFGVTLLEGFADEVTADVALSPGLVYDPTLPINLPGMLDTTTTPPHIHFGTSVLGFFSGGFTKTVSFQARIADDGTAAPGDAIAPIATIHTISGPDTVILPNVLTVAPPPADLQPSTLTCTDLNGDPLRPADTVQCVVRLANLPMKEDAVGVMAQVPVPLNAAWAGGGNESFHTPSMITFGPSAIPGGVESGAPPGADLTFRLTVADVPAGSTIFPYAAVTYSNALSQELGSHTVFGPALVTAPGPAVLTASTLRCVDVDGGALYAGDTVDCTLTATDAPGHEDVADLAGTAAVPTWTTPAGGTTAPVFGSLASGTSRSAGFRLRVADDAPPGTRVAPTAQLRGRSVGTGVAVTHALEAPPLIVAARPPAAAAAAGPGVASPVAGVATPAKVTPGRICASRRVVVVNVRPPKGRRWRSLTATFAGRRVTGRRTGKTGYFRARLVFQGLPKGRITVKLAGVTTRGRTVRSTRTYTLCATKKG